MADPEDTVHSGETSSEICPNGYPMVQGHRYCPDCESERAVKETPGLSSSGGITARKVPSVLTQPRYPSSWSSADYVAGCTAAVIAPNNGGMGFGA